MRRARASQGAQGLSGSVESGRRVDGRRALARTRAGTRTSPPRPAAKVAIYLLSPQPGWPERRSTCHILPSHPCQPARMLPCPAASPSSHLLICLRCAGNQCARATNSARTRRLPRSLLLFLSFCAAGLSASEIMLMYVPIDNQGRGLAHAALHAFCNHAVKSLPGAKAIKDMAASHGLSSVPETLVTFSCKCHMRSVGVSVQ